MAAKTPRKSTASARPPRGCHLPATAKARAGGWTAIVRSKGGEPQGADTGIDLRLFDHRGRFAWKCPDEREAVWVLLRGTVQVKLNGDSYSAARKSVFDEGPFTVHCFAGAELAMRSDRSGAEWAVLETRNPRANVKPRVLTNEECRTEDRGAGLAQGACRRLVRTIFDHETQRDSNLVVGEVLNLAGRWSSYPPHYHPQPELYHYRFTEPQGYGHAEVGEAVYKVRNRDTTVIPGGFSHAQVSAPGYGMYYLWVVRHLPRRPYTGFTFAPEHRWLLDSSQQGWKPNA